MTNLKRYIQRWKDVSEEAPPEIFSVGQIVYEKRRGWSGIPLQVVDVGETNSEGRCIVVVKRGSGWGIDGLYSEKYDAKIRRLSNASLTIIPNSAI